MTLNTLWITTSNYGGWLNELCVITSNGCATRALNLNEKDVMHNKLIALGYIKE